jgi:flagellar basal-body rod protein FlgG
MFKGFYNLTSAMFTHQENLNVISNNIVNISTAGYKEDRYTATTFDEVLMNRIGNKYLDSQELGDATSSYIRATDHVYSDFTQGTLEPTDISLDFAISGEGFFAVQDINGNIEYTRMGTFSLDDEGYLCLPGYGQVLDPNGDPILLNTDKIYGDTEGNIYYNDGTLLARLGIYQFEDNAVLYHNGQGLFSGEGAVASDTGYEIWNTYVERSNTDMVRQMTEVITYERALQSAAQVAKMYDNLMTKATTELGRMQ